MLEGETVLYGEEKIPGIVINDDGDRLRVRFLGPEITGLLWIPTELVQLCLDEGNVY